MSKIDEEIEDLYAKLRVEEAEMKVMHETY